MYGALQRFRVKVRHTNGTERIVSVDARNETQAGNRAVACATSDDPGGSWQVVTTYA